jgi:mannose-1-phosphate guanylyltransferase
VQGRPLLYWWGKLFEKHGVTEVLVNVHHHADQVERYLATHWRKCQFKIVYEESLLGSAGTLRENRSFIKNGEDFFVAYADVLTNLDLTDLLWWHRGHTYPITMSAKQMDDVMGRGIVVHNGITVVDFQEKPKEPRSDYVNAGVYVMERGVLDSIPGKDIAYDLLPMYIGNMGVYLISDYLRDIGTLEDLKLANDEFSGL